VPLWLRQGGDGLGLITTLQSQVLASGLGASSLCPGTYHSNFPSRWELLFLRDARSWQYRRRRNSPLLLRLCSLPSVIIQARDGTTKRRHVYRWLAALLLATTPVLSLGASVAISIWHRALPWLSALGLVNRPGRGSERKTGIPWPGCTFLRRPNGLRAWSNIRLGFWGYSLSVSVSSVETSSCNRRWVATTLPANTARGGAISLFVRRSCTSEHSLHRPTRSYPFALRIFGGVSFLEAENNARLVCREPAKLVLEKGAPVDLLLAPASPHLPKPLASRKTIFRLIPPSLFGLLVARR